MKVGDYVRTPNGIITKIIDIQDEEGQYFINNNAVSLSSKTYIADKNVTIGENFKHNQNIKDLIEEGDYVNGHLVIKRHDDLMLEDTFDLVQDEDIKSIVTKECFASMEYKVGD